MPNFINPAASTLCVCRCVIVSVALFMFTRVCGCAQSIARRNSLLATKAQSKERKETSDFYIWRWKKCRGTAGVAVGQHFLKHTHTFFSFASFFPDSRTSKLAFDPCVSVLWSGTRAGIGYRGSTAPTLAPRLHPSIIHPTQGHTGLKSQAEKGSVRDRTVVELIYRDKPPHTPTYTHTPTDHKPKMENI